MTVDTDALMATLRKDLQRRNYAMGGICEVCGETNPLALKITEEHHLSGKAYSPVTATLCLNCHAVISTDVDLLRKHRDGQIPPRERLAIILQSHNAIEARMAEMKEKLLRMLVQDEDAWSTPQSESTPEDPKTKRTSKSVVAQEHALPNSPNSGE